MAKTEERLAKKIPHLARKQIKQPGSEAEMAPQPKIEKSAYLPSQKLRNKVALITGGDSGIGHAVALLYAKEGADIAIAYLDEHEDAKKVQQQIEAIGRNCLLIAGDLSREKFCQKVVKQVIAKFKRIDILVNNIAVQYPQETIADIDEKQLTKTFTTNIFSYFFMTKAVLPHFKKGHTIINTTSITAYKGNPTLIDYSATKGAIVAFTRSLSESLIKQGIRVNAVAPGPVWTPLIPSSFDLEKVKKFGKNVPMGRVGQPDEIAPCYLFLASEDSSYMSGQVLHPNGGVIVNG